MEMNSQLNPKPMTKPLLSKILNGPTDSTQNSNISIIMDIWNLVGLTKLLLLKISIYLLQLMKFTTVNNRNLMDVIFSVKLMLNKMAWLSSI